MTDETQDEQSFEDAFNEFANTEEESKEEVPQAVEVKEELPQDEEAKEGEPQEIAAQETSKPDPWNGVPEALKTEFEKLKKDHDYWQHRYQSDVGRVSAYQRQVEELKQQLGQRKDEPGKSEVNAAMESPEKWKEFKEEYPEVAEYLEPLRNQLGQLKTSFDAIQGQLSPLQQAEKIRTQQESFKRIGEVHNDWVDIVKHPTFDQWLTRQSPGMRGMASSDDPEDVIALVSNFKHWANQQLANTQTPANAGSSPAQAGQSVDAIKQRRAQQLADAQTAPNRGRASENAIPADDFEAAFAVYAKQKERAYR
jgi:hypothetical protein